MGAITGGLSTTAAFFAYQVFLGMFGYSYADNLDFWLMLGLAVTIGCIMGCMGKNGYDELVDEELKLRK